MDLPQFSIQFKKKKKRKDKKRNGWGPYSTQKKKGVYCRIFISSMKGFELTQLSTKT